MYLVTGGAGFIGSNIVRKRVDNYDCRFAGWFDSDVGIRYNWYHKAVDIIR